MKKAFHLTSLLAVAICLSPARAEAPPDKPVLAVFNTDVRGDFLEPAVVDLLSDELCAALEKTAYYGKVVAPRVLKRALVDAMKGKFDACYDKLCQFALGKEVDADRVVSSRISKIGRTCVVSLIVWDVDRRVSVQAGTARGACSRNDLMNTVRAAARQLPGSEAQRPRAAPKKKAPAQKEEPR